nr:hypothetical protein [Gemmata massiliana]
MQELTRPGSPVRERRGRLLHHTDADRLVVLFLYPALAESAFHGCPNRREHLLAVRFVPIQLQILLQTLNHVVDQIPEETRFVDVPRASDIPRPLNDWHNMNEMHTTSNTLA